MSPQELTAIMLIVNKLGWNDKPAVQTIKQIKQMVSNQISLELDCIGDSAGFEETLLSLATWDKEDIVSTQYVSDYQSFSNWNYSCEADDAFEHIKAYDYDWLEQNFT